MTASSSGVVSNLTGVSSRAMLEALVSGERDPEVPARYTQERLRPKIPELFEALNGRFGEHHTFMVGVHLDQIDQRSADIAAFTGQKDGEIYKDPGAGYYIRRDPEQVLGRTAGPAILRVRPPPLLHLVGEILPWRRRRHPKACQQFEALLIQRLTCVSKVSHHREPGLVLEAETQSLTACSFIGKLALSAEHKPCCPPEARVPPPP